MTLADQANSKSLAEATQPGLPGRTVAEQRWILSQQIGLASHLLCLSQREPGRLKSYLYYVWLIHDLANKLKRSYGSSSKKQDEWIYSLPPSTLHLLRRLRNYIDPYGDRREETTLWNWVGPDGAVERAFNFLTVGDKGTQRGGKETPAGSWLARVQSFTHAIIHGHGDPQRIARFGRFLFDGQWKTWEAWVDDDSVRTALLAIRDPNTCSGKRVDQIDHLNRNRWPVHHEARAPHIARWLGVQVQNALLHEACAWPLLVYGNQGLVLPVLIDVKFPHAVDNPSGQSKRLEIMSRDLLDLGRGPGSFYDSLNLAVEGAWALWRKANGNNSKDWKNQVDRALHCFDFTLAEAILNDTIPNISFEKRFKLTGRSAGGYFAQEILSRYLGRSVGIGGLMTGLVGDQAKEEGEWLHDYWIESPKAIPAKLEHAFHAHFISRIVVPEDSREIVASTLRHKADKDVQQTAQIFGAAKLSNAADILQSCGWRRHNYVRCPEIGWSVLRHLQQSHLGFADANSDAHQVLSWLRETPHSIIHLRAGGSGSSSQSSGHPLAVASALVHVDQEVRFYQCDEGGRPDHQIRRENPQSALSWAFVRMRPREEHTEFWRTIWRLIGATDASFHHFCQSPTVGHAAEHLVNAMNVFESDRDARSHRAPDMLVLLNYSKTVEKHDSSAAPDAYPLAPPAIFKYLHEKQVALEGSGMNVSESRNRCPGMKAALGRARVLLLDGDAPSLPWKVRKIGQGINLDQFKPSYREALKLLSVYDHGFTHHEAATLLSMMSEPPRGNEVRERLDELETSNLIYEFGGEYFIPTELHARLRQPDAAPGLLDSNVLGHQVEAHKRAALALAPYLSNVEYPSLSYELAFLPENVSQAWEHLEHCRNLLREQRITCYVRWAEEDRKGSEPEVKGDRDALVQTNNNLQRYQVTLVRAAMWPGPDIVRHLPKLGAQDASGEEGYRIAREFIGEYDRRAGQQHTDRSSHIHRGYIAPHPLFLIRTAEALNKSWDNPDEGGTWPTPPIDELNSLFDRALEKAESLASDSSTYWKLRARCSRADILDEMAKKEATRKGEEDRDLRSKQLIKIRDEVDEEIWSLRDYWANAGSDGQNVGITGEWLERQGDEASTAKESAGRYLLGVKLGISWVRLPFKALGACRVAGIRIWQEPKLNEWLREFSKQDLSEVVNMLIKFSSSQYSDHQIINKGRKNKAVRKYWQAAAQHLVNQWGERDQRVKIFQLTLSRYNASPCPGNSYWAIRD